MEGSGIYDHSIVSAMWKLGGSQELLDTYRKALDAHGMDEKILSPALRFTTSDVAASGANLYPMLLTDGPNGVISLGSPIKLAHDKGATILDFRKNLEQVCARYVDAMKNLTQLMDIEIRNPVNCLKLLMKELGIKQKIRNEVDISNLSREDWLEYRKKGIGGSDVAAIMGISPFATIRDLFYNKTGVQPVIQEEEESNWVAKDVGHRLEDLVAEIFSKKTGLEVFPVRVMFRHPLYPFMLADVDFFVRMPDGTFAILECKTCNYNAKDKWADEGIPAHYVLQVRHYLSVMNMQKAFIACLYGNNENEFVYRTIERDLIEEEDIIDQETYFWQEHVLKNVVPPHNGNSDLVLANIRNYGGFADKSIPEIVLSGLESKNLEKYLTLSEEKSQLEKRKKEIEAEQRAISVPFVEQLGQGCKAVLEDGTNRYRITYNPTRRTSVGKDQMEKLKNQHPDIYEEYTKTTESRTFRIKKEAA